MIRIDVFMSRLPYGIIMLASYLVCIHNASCFALQAPAEESSCLFRLLPFPARLPTRTRACRIPRRPQAP